MVSYKTDNTRDEVIIFVGEMRIVPDDKGVPIFQQYGTDALNALVIVHLRLPRWTYSIISLILASKFAAG
jgi:hypothetical protein